MSRFVILTVAICVLNVSKAQEGPISAEVAERVIKKTFDDCTNSGCDYARIAVNIDQRLQPYAMQDGVARSVRDSVGKLLGAEVQQVLQTRASTLRELQPNLDRSQALLRFILTTPLVGAADRQAVIRSISIPLKSPATRQDIPETWSRWFAVLARVSVEDPNNLIDDDTLKGLVLPFLDWGFAQRNAAAVMAVVSVPGQYKFKECEANLEPKAAEAVRLMAKQLTEALERMREYHGLGTVGWRNRLLHEKLDDGDFSADFWRRFGTTLEGLTPPTTTAAKLFCDDLQARRYKEATQWVHVASQGSGDDGRFPAAREHILAKFAAMLKSTFESADAQAISGEMSEMTAALREKISGTDAVMKESLLSALTTVASAGGTESDQSASILRVASCSRALGMDGASLRHAMVDAAAMGGQFPLFWNAGNQYLRTAGSSALSMAGYKEAMLQRAAEKQSWDFLRDCAARSELSTDAPSSLKQAIETALDRAQGIVPPEESAVLFYLRSQPVLGLRERWVEYLQDSGKVLKVQLAFETAKVDNNYLGAIEVAAQLRELKSPKAEQYDQDALDLLLRRMQTEPLKASEGEITGRAIASLAGVRQGLRDRLLAGVAEAASGVPAERGAFEEWINCLETSSLFSRERIVQMLAPSSLGMAERVYRLEVLTMRWGMSVALDLPWHEVLVQSAQQRDWPFVRKLLRDPVLGGHVQPVLEKYLDEQLQERFTLVAGCSIVEGVLADSTETWALKARARVATRLAEELRSPGTDPVFLEQLVSSARTWRVDDATLLQAVQHLVGITPPESDQLARRVMLLLDAAPSPQAHPSQLYGRVLRVMVARNDRNQAIFWRNAGVAASAFSAGDAAALDIVRRWEVEREKEQVLIDTFSFTGRWTGSFVVEDSTTKTGVDLDLAAQGAHPNLSSTNGTLKYDSSSVRVSTVSLDRKARRITFLLANAVQLHPALPGKALWAGSFRLVGERAGQIEIELDHGPREAKTTLTLKKAT